MTSPASRRPTIRPRTRTVPGGRDRATAARTRGGPAAASPAGAVPRHGAAAARTRPEATAGRQTAGPARSRLRSADAAWRRAQPGLAGGRAQPAESRRLRPAGNIRSPDRAVPRPAGPVPTLARPRPTATATGRAAAGPPGRVHRRRPAGRPSGGDQFLSDSWYRDSPPARRRVSPPPGYDAPGYDGRAGPGQRRPATRPGRLRHRPARPARIGGRGLTPRPDEGAQYEAAPVVRCRAAGGPGPTTRTSPIRARRTATSVTPAATPARTTATATARPAGRLQDGGRRLRRRAPARDPGGRRGRLRLHRGARELPGSGGA